MTHAIALPLPTSANRIWRTYGKRTVKSPDYVRWQNTAHSLISLDRKLGLLQPIVGQYDLTVHLPIKTRCDADNYIKGISDILQLTGIVENDNLVRDIHILRRDVAKGHCQIFVSGI